jgi:peroxiredoxin
MTYHVVAFTMAQVRTGALDFQRHLSTIVREQKDIKVYQVSPFDLDERKRFKDRFGGDIVYFLNDAARTACDLDGLEMHYLGEIPETELPKRKTLVIGIPD